MKNKLKIATIMVSVAAAMVIYKVIIDRREAKKEKVKSILTDTRLN